MLLNRSITQLPQFRSAISLAQPNTIEGRLGSLDRGELPYIYHHLRKGCILQVQRLFGTDQRHLLFNVSYGGFHLGVLSRNLADCILQMEAENKPFRLTIACIEREKYLPPTAVYVALEWGSGE
jgi:hypothetical protein